MGSINKSHNEVDGGILLYNGELILLYCDSVSCEIGGKETVKGRVYLTTHRMVLLVTPYKPNSAIKSLCAPFCAITKINLEQPIFGANYIEATVSDETDSSKTFSFKLKFSKGGAVEFAMTMNRAVAAVARFSNPSTRPPAYTPSPTDSFYQAPPTVYAPGYNCGVQMPLSQFPDQPPIGFIYTSVAPPPYPGLSGNPQQQTAGRNEPPPPYQAGQNPSGFLGQQQPTGGYPGQQQPTGGYPGQKQPTGGYPGQQQSGGYPGQQQPTGGYPGQQQSGGYPGQQQPTGGYPGQQQSGGYPGQQQQGVNPSPAVSAPTASIIGFQPSGSVYPDPNLPSAPAFNPDWDPSKKA